MASHLFFLPYRAPFLMGHTPNHTTRLGSLHLAFSGTRWGAEGPWGKKTVSTSMSTLTWWEAHERQTEVSWQNFLGPERQAKKKVQRSIMSKRQNYSGTAIEYTHRHSAFLNGASQPNNRNMNDNRSLAHHHYENIIQLPSYIFSALAVYTKLRSVKTQQFQSPTPRGANQSLNRFLLLLQAYKVCISDHPCSPSWPLQTTHKMRSSVMPSCSASPPTVISIISQASLSHARSQSRRTTKIRSQWSSCCTPAHGWLGAAETVSSSRTTWSNQTSRWLLSTTAWDPSVSRYMQHDWDRENNRRKDKNLRRGTHENGR